MKTNNVVISPVKIQHPSVLSGGDTVEFNDYAPGRAASIELAQVKEVRMLLEGGRSRPVTHALIGIVPDMTLVVLTDGRTIYGHQLTLNTFDRMSGRV